MPEMQPVPWYKGASKDAHHAITRSTTMKYKLQAIDAYIDSKMNVYLDMRMNPHDQSGFLQRKIEQLARSLPDSDADLLRARGNYFIEHIAGLCNQWSRKSTFSTSASATAAFQADRAFNWSDGLAIVKQYLLRSTHKKQGPRARFEAMREARHAVQAAIAFPKPPQWQTELDQFMQQEAMQGVLADPGYYSETAAKVLNTAPQHKVVSLADRYFYSKIVTPWSVAVNQGHIDDKLYALLPQLRRSPELQQIVQDRAECCKATMRYMLRNHIAQQSRHHHAAEYAASFVQAANSSSASSTGAAATKGVSFVAVPDGEVCFVNSPDGDCQIARRTPA